MKRVHIVLTDAQAYALTWAGNMGLEEARQEGMKPQTIEAACRALEAIVRARGYIPYRRAGAIYGRRTTRETSHTQH